MVFDLIVRISEEHSRDGRSTPERTHINRLDNNAMMVAFYVVKEEREDKKKKHGAEEEQ